MTSTPRSDTTDIVDVGLLGIEVVRQGSGEMKAGINYLGGGGGRIEKQCKKRCRRKVVFTLLLGAVRDVRVLDKW